MFCEPSPKQIMVDTVVSRGRLVVMTTQERDSHQKIRTVE